VSKLQITKMYDSALSKQTINICKGVTMLMLKTILKMRTKMLGHQFWINLREGVDLCRRMPVYANLAMEVSGSHGRCMIYRHVRTK
jgi:hypothetical protein